MSRPIDLDTAIESMTTVIWHYHNELYKGLNQYEAARGLAEMGLLSLPSVQPESNCFGCKHLGMWEDEVEYGYPSPCTRCKRRANDNYESN